MLTNEVDLNIILQDNYKDHDSEFNWRRGNRIHNKSTYFALPFIGLSVEGNICSRYLRNAYLDDKTIEHDFERPLFVLFRVKNLKEKFWIDFCKTAPMRENYVMDYYVGQEGENTLIMYVFQVPEKWAKDFKLFKQGCYSKMSKTYKDLFDQYLYTPSGDKRETRMWGILNKSEALKDEVVKRFINPGTSTPDDVILLRRDINTWDEVWDAPNDNAEIFHIKDAIENIVEESGTG